MPGGSSAGGKALLAKYGREYFVELGRKGAAARKAKLRENLIVVLTEAANRIVEKARANASWSSEIPNAIRFENVEEHGGLFYVDIIIDTSEETGAPQAAAFEYGSGIHSSKGDRKTYPIDPVNARYLVFNWPGVDPKPFLKPSNDPEHKIYFATEDGTFVFRHVDHPGVKAKPYLQPAMVEEKERLLRDLASGFKKAMIEAVVFTGE